MSPEGHSIHRDVLWGLDAGTVVDAAAGDTPERARDYVNTTAAAPEGVEVTPGMPKQRAGSHHGGLGHGRTTSGTTTPGGAIQPARLSFSVGSASEPRRHFARAGGGPGRRVEMPVDRDRRAAGPVQIMRRAETTLDRF
jgi:hypothetical protein